MTDRIGIQNLSPEIVDSPDLACVMATKVEAYGIALDDPGNGENFVELEIGWNNDTTTRLSIDLEAAQMLLSRLAQALLGIAPNHATFRIDADTGVRIDCSKRTVATIAIDGLSSGVLDGGPILPHLDWEVDDRRDHVYGDFSCSGTSDCRRCATATA